ncbi:MAG: ABC transporter permease [Candidatus Cloacimonadaceae bacterium]
MHIGDGIISAWVSINSHKMRSVLTAIGIVIGIMAVVTMFSSVYLIKELISTNMESMGWNNMLVIYPSSGGGGWGYSHSAVKTQRRGEQLVRPLSFDDYIALKDQLEYKSIYGMINNELLQLVGGEQKYITVKSTGNDFFFSKSYGLQDGRYFSKVEEEQGLPVAVIGEKYVKEYLPEGNVLGETVILGEHRFKVVGILGEDTLNKEGSGMNFNSWERKSDLQAIYVPLKYGAYRFQGQKMLHSIHLQSKDEKSYNNMMNKSRQILLSRHNMYPNFVFWDSGAMMLTITEEMDKILGKWNITLFAIASISLIVGGIGLFSTLLISIQERMLEIGVRKSIGASEKDIFFFFIVESLMLSLAGALVGILLSSLLIKLAGSVIKMSMGIPIAGVLVGLLFAVIVGAVSGIYPAFKAAKLDPIRAIYFFE